MPNPNPVQSELLKQRRFQRAVVRHSGVPADATLAGRAISVKLPAEVDQAIRDLGKQKAAWLRESHLSGRLAGGASNKASASGKGLFVQLSYVTFACL